MAGLRREEVALLASMSVTYYTFLEQGRPVRPSAQVVDALAAALRFSPAERDYLRVLAHGGGYGEAAGSSHPAALAAVGRIAAGEAGQLGQQPRRHECPLASVRRSLCRVAA